MPIGWIKNVDELTVADVDACPVWEFTNSDAHGELAVRPIDRRLVDHLDGRLVGTSVVLRNGTTVTALPGNVSSTDPRKTRHFLTLAVAHAGRWLHLARYHDLDRDRHGPDWLAASMGLRLDQVFPIAYDLRHVSQGHPEALCGSVDVDIEDKLTRAELIALAVP